MEQSLQIKYERLKESLLKMHSVAVAFSAGADSSLLVKIANDVLCKNMAAITVKSCLIQKSEIDFAINFCKCNNILHKVVDFDALTVKGFVKNSENRCYICKRALLSCVKDAAKFLGLNVICEGSNKSDTNDYRPGARAVDELCIKSPLKECDFTKDDVRALSRELYLPTWNKPAMPCLASRIPYGEIITQQKLNMINKAEDILQNLGLSLFRVRLHQGVLSKSKKIPYTARIEIAPEHFEKIICNRGFICNAFEQIGFTYISLDLFGFKSGNMNKIL